MWAVASDATERSHAQNQKVTDKNAGKAGTAQAESDAGTKDRKKLKKGRAAFAQVFEEVSPKAFVFQVGDQVSDEMESPAQEPPVSASPVEGQAGKPEHFEEDRIKNLVAKPYVPIRHVRRAKLSSSLSP